jgi:hypothetical protein
VNRSSMSKQMMQEGGPVVPSKEEFEAMSPKEKAARKKKAMMQNINLSPKEKMDKEKKEMKGMKKMNMGGMATANKYDRNTKERREEADMQSGRLKFEKAPAGPLKMKKGGKVKPVKKMNMGGMTAPSGMDAAAMMAMKKKKRKPMMPAKQAMDGGAAMPMMKKGGKVRGYGMARGGKACKMR